MRKTVFVVGAGASSEFGLPLGSDLVVQIRDAVAAEVDNFNNQPITLAAMILASEQGLGGDFDRAARDLAGGMNVARSIDRFLASRANDALVTHLGKVAIAHSIALSERRSLLGSHDLTDWHQAQRAMNQLQSTWLDRLFATLQEGVAPQEGSRVFEDVSFITFNYDRVIERYLRLAFTHALGQSDDAAERIVNAIPIHHVYGSLGDLPTNDIGGVPYALPEEMLRSAVVEMSKRIRTFTERFDSEVLVRCRQAIEDAELVVFLGFAFDPLNVEALFPEPLRHDQICMGTRLGIGPTEQQALNERIAPNGVNPSLMAAAGCSEFIRSNTFRGVAGK